MLSFHGKQEIKDFYLNRVHQHRAADNLIHGTRWDGYKGSAVGCTLEKYDPLAYENKLGIPQVLARLEDGIFENLPDENAMDWPEMFLTVIPVGVDLSFVWPKFAVWILIDDTDGILKYAQTKQERESIKLVAKLYQKQAEGKKVSLKQWNHAAYVADATRAAAYDAAYAAYADDAAAYATYAAAPETVGAARVVPTVVPRAAARIKQANKLLELLADCK